MHYTFLEIIVTKIKNHNICSFLFINEIGCLECVLLLKEVIMNR